MKLFDGTGFLLHKTGAKVVTCYLRGAKRLPFSPNRELKKLFPKVTAHFSEVLEPDHKRCYRLKEHYRGKRAGRKWGTPARK